MEKLLNGVVKFQNKYFVEHKHVFKELSNKQNPHTLFIGCSDSRVIPNLITRALPGELFVMRNIGNMVPPYYENNATYRCVAAVIEYSVKSLNVENIVICGHSNCGGCKALLKEEHLDELPLVKEWLKLGENIKKRVMAKNISDEEKEFQIEQLNIVQQIENILTYPFVKEKYDKGELNIYGWYYIIETGEVFNYNFEKNEFELLE